MTTNDSPEEEETLETHICQTRSEAHSPSGCVDVCHHSPLPHNQIPPLSRGESKGWEVEIWRFDQRQKGICLFFLNITLKAASPDCRHTSLCASMSLYSVCIQRSAVCTNVKSRLKGGKNSVSLDESACCLLKLLEQQQSRTLWVPVSLISCCHFSSCSLVNHLSRSPPCNQLNLVIKWRKRKNAAQRRCRLLQKKHVPATKWCAFRQENRSAAATGFKSVCVLLKVI